MSIDDCVFFINGFFLSPRVKFDMSNGTLNGEETNCKKDGSNCLHLYTYWNDLERGYSSYKSKIAKHNAPSFGEWVDFTAAISFSEEELSHDNQYLTLILYHVGELFFQPY